ncbi:synergin gamma isoform X3 [Paramormyrops kingsleyae]|uniref:synergin gamma isoform X3 n=1 Tax=Paramormyrops kingsleyae TaxID=1676925 RepID=UPI003B973133
MALRPGAGGGGSFMYPVGGGLGPPQGLIPLQQQQGFPMVQVMQPNMQGMMGMNFGAQMPPGAMPIQGTMPMAMQAQGMPFMGQPPFMGMRAPGPQFSADVQKQMAEEHQKRLEQQARLLEEDRKRRQFEEQKQKLRLLSSVKPKTGERSRDDALEAIKGNLDGFSRDAKMHPTPSTHPNKPDASPCHSSVTSHSLTPTFPEEDDDFSDFIQGPVEAPPLPPPTTSSGPSPLPQSLLHSLPITSSSSSAFKGPSLEEKLLSSCDFHASGQAQVNFKARRLLAQMGPREQVAAQFQPSSRARNWAGASDELSKVFAVESPATQAPPAPPAAAKDSGVAVFPQQEHMQPMLPAWLYNDSLVPELFKKVLEFSMTPSGVDTAKLYPILMSSGLPREALGQIWATANRTTPGKLTKEELYSVLAMIGVAQSGLPVMGLDVLSQFPSPPVPSLPALAMGVPPVLPQHPAPMIAQPPVAMAVPTAAPAPMGVASMGVASMGVASMGVASMGVASMGVASMGVASSTAAQPPASFVASFPPAQGGKPDDDDFQEFQEAPKAGAAEDSFTDFQGESGAPATSVTPSQSSGPVLLTPVSGSSSASSDKYAVFKQLSVEQTVDTAPPASDSADKYSVFRELEPPSDRKPVGEGFADFKSASADDGFTDFKTADSISPLDPSDSAKMVQPTFSPAFPKSHPLQPQLPAPLSQPRNPLNMADLDLFSSLAPPGPPADGKLPSFPSPGAAPSVAVAPPPSTGSKPSGGGVDDFGDFALFGSSSGSPSAAAGAVTAGAGSVAQDDFADFMAFGSAGEAWGDTRPGASSLGERQSQRQQPPQHRGAPDKYDVFKQLSLEGGLAYDDAKEGSGSLASLRGDADDFADFQSSKFCTALGASEKSLTDKLAKEDSSSVKSLDLPSIGGSSAGKDDSEDALSVQLDMKLSDVGGDLKHVMSDSSLDLPGLSAHQPPSAETDDSRFDPFGTLTAGSSGSSDWPDREDSSASQAKAALAGMSGPDGFGAPSSAVMRRKETSFGSTENVTRTTEAKVTTFPTADDASKLEAFTSFGPHCVAPAGEDDDFGDFASTVSEKLGPCAEPGPDRTSSEAASAFQGDKPKFGKSDFLKVSAQAKVKSSEEMIQNELATFDLSVQGSHKRSHSLGDKEISRSTPSPAPETPFRDRSNTLSEKPALPVIRDKYKDLTGEVEESERYAYEWQRCLESALQVISKANDTLNNISSSAVCTEVIQSEQGMDYLLGVVEVYRVTKRVELGIKATAVCSEKLQNLLKDISRVWNNLMGFMSLASLTPDESSLDFSSCILRHGIRNAKELACGVCLLNVDSRSKALTKDSDRRFRAFNSETDNFKLLYGGHQYHASCANFWINCVEPKPPGLVLPDLL